MVSVNHWVQCNSHSRHSNRETKVPHPVVVFVHFGDFSCLNREPSDCTTNYQSHSNGLCSESFPRRKQMMILQGWVAWVFRSRACHNAGVSISQIRERSHPFIKVTQPREVTPLDTDLWEQNGNLRSRKLFLRRVEVSRDWQILAKGSSVEKSVLVWTSGRERAQVVRKSRLLLL